MNRTAAFQISLEKVTGYVDFHPVIEIKRFNPDDDIWRIADEVLLGWAENAPDDGSYLRVEYVVYYDDGHSFPGFLLLERANADDPELAPDIAGEVRACAETFSGRRRPGWTRTKEEYVDLLRVAGRASRERHMMLLDRYEVPGVQPAGATPARTTWPPLAQTPTTAPPVPA